MRSKTETAVILVNYNGLKDTIECIESLMNSTTPLQIIVVDNASTNDESLTISENYPFVKTIRTNKNLGFAGGNNIGIQWALDNNFKYIALLNNDTIVDNKAFSYLLELANENTVTAPYMFYFSSPDDLWYAGGTINKKTGNAVHIEKNNLENGPFNCTFVTGCCFLAHRIIWEKTGLLDESYFMYNEDTDFCIRLLMNHFSIKVIPKAKIWHKIGKSSGNYGSAFSHYYNTRNRLAIVKKYPLFFHRTAYPYTIITRIYWMIKLRLQNKPEWKAFFMAIKDFRNGIKGNNF